MPVRETGGGRPNRLLHQQLLTPGQEHDLSTCYMYLVCSLVSLHARGLSGEMDWGREKE